MQQLQRGIASLRNQRKTKKENYVKIKYLKINCSTNFSTAKIFYQGTELNLR